MRALPTDVQLWFSEPGFVLGSESTDSRSGQHSGSLSK